MTQLKLVIQLILTIVFPKIILAQQLVSPCPRLFQYEQKPEEPDRWYGTATLISDAELTGVWFRILLDKPSVQLGNWFGEVEPRDNNLGYLIKNPQHKLAPKTPFQLRFYIRYNPNEPPPQLKEMRLNARTICPEGGTTTPAPVSTGQLFTNKPLMEPLSAPSAPAGTAAPQGGGGGNFGGGGDTFGGGSNFGGFGIGGSGFQRPNSEEDDFYEGDFNLLYKPGAQNLLNNVACGTVIKQPKPLITHGQATHEGEFPWHAAIYHSKGIDLTYICGASLISMQHLITVAHCVTRKKSQQPLSPNNVVIYLGKYYLRVWSNPGIQDRRVENIIVHPKYSPQNYGNDIAVLKLADPIQLTDYVRPVCLWEGPSQLDKVVDKLGVVVGWGFDENGKVTEQLTKAHMPIVSQETCIYSYPDFYSRFTSSTTFCAGFKNGTSVCNGDSGGGLVIPRSGSEQAGNAIWQIRGLVSISVALQNRFRCDSSHYVVFTDVAKFLDFIKKAMEQ